MKLENFAHLILFGTSLEEKLIQTDLEPESHLPSLSPIEIPAFPVYFITI